MNQNAQYLRIEECRKALESCTHDHGTVRSVCSICLDRRSVSAWDCDDAVFVEIDCPRCGDEIADGGVEVCPCLEDFSSETIARAIGNLRAKSVDRHKQDL